MTVKVKFSKKFKPQLEGQGRAVSRLGRMVSLKIRKRIEQRGQTSDRKALPRLEDHGWWITQAGDPRKLAGVVPRYAKGQKGTPPVLRVSLDGYAAMKLRTSGKRRRGQSLTGAMWRSLRVSVTTRKSGHRVRIYFGGTQRVGKDFDRLTKSGRPRAKSVRNRDKARLLQYKDRKKGMGPPEARGRPDFLLMAIAPKELAAARDIYLRALRLFV